MFSAEIPAAEISTSFATRVGNASASSAPMNPPIELPTTTGDEISKPLAERVDHPREALDRDPPRRHLRAAEARQVRGDHAEAVHERRDVQQPVLPQPAEPVQEQQRRAGAAGVHHVDAPAEDHLGARQRRPVDRRPRRIVPVGVRRVRLGADERVGGERAYLPEEPRHAATVPAAVRLAIDIDSTLHPYWDQLADVAQRRFGVELPYETQYTWAIDRLEPAQLKACVKETHTRRARARRRALPGRGGDDPAPGTSRATSSTSPATATPTPTRTRASG